MSKYSFIIENMEWSISRIMTYDTCPYSFFLTYILSKENIDNFFSEYGSFGHSILERYFKNELNIWDLVSEYTDKFNENVTKPTPPSRNNSMWSNYYNAGLKYFSEFEGMPGKVLGVEKLYKFKIGKYNFKGIIDLIIEEDDGLIIVDHKSKSKMSKKEKEKYLRQLYSYSIPVFDAYKKYPKELRFNMFRYQEWIDEQFDETKLVETKKWCIEKIEEINNDNIFKPNVDRFFCNYICGQRLNCDHYKN